VSTRIVWRLERRAADFLWHSELIDIASYTGSSPDAKDEEEFVCHIDALE
jgi:hypothetical protein